MIPAPTAHGYDALLARQSITDPDETVTVDVPVLAWGEDGIPLIVYNDRLTPADQVPGYIGVRPALPPMLGAVPGDGWHVEVATEDGTTWSAPVIAWHVRPWDLATPIVASPQGVIGYPQNLGTTWRAYHPDAAVKADAA